MKRHPNHDAADSEANRALRELAPMLAAVEGAAGRWAAKHGDDCRCPFCKVQLPGDVARHLTALATLCEIVRGDIDNTAFATPEMFDAAVGRVAEGRPDA